jgi:AraC-like DNA-binding protein
MNRDRRLLAEWDRLDCRLLHLYDGLVPRRGDAYYDTPACIHHMWLIRRGDLRVTTKGCQSVKAGNGQWLINSPTSRRLQAFSKDLRILSIWFVSSWPGDTPLFDKGLPLTFRASAVPALTDSAERLATAVERPTCWPESSVPLRRLPLDRALAVEARFKDFVACWFDALCSRGIKPICPSPIDPRVAACAAELERPRFLSCVPYERLTRLGGLSRVQLDRLFRSELGVTPKAYADRQCLAAAMRTLAEGHRSIKEIAYGLGFQTPAHFSAWFRKVRGETPRQYRRKAREGV